MKRIWARIKQSRETNYLHAQRQAERRRKKAEYFQRRE